MVDSTRKSAIKYGALVLLLIVGTIVAGATHRMSTPKPADPPDVDTSEDPSVLLNQSICHLQLSDHRYEQLVVQHNDTGPDNRYVRVRGIVENSEYEHYSDGIVGGYINLEAYGNDAMGYSRTEYGNWTADRSSRFGGYTVTVSEDGPPRNPRIVERSDERIVLEVAAASDIFVLGVSKYEDVQEHTLTISLDRDTGRIRRIERTVTRSSEHDYDNFTIITTISYDNATVSRPDDLGFRPREVLWDIYDGRPPELECSVGGE